MNKDLQYFKDDVAKGRGLVNENSAIKHFINEYESKAFFFMKMEEILDEAAERYAISQKHSGFIEGAEKMVRDVIVFLEIVTQRTPEFPIEEMKGVFQEAMRIVVEKVESMTLPASPYEPREKGGEDGL